MKKPNSPLTMKFLQKIVKFLKEHELPLDKDGKFEVRVKNVKHGSNRGKRYS